MRRRVHVVRTTVLCGVLFFAATFSNAQSISTPNGKLEVGIGLGPLFFLGDLGGNQGVGTYFVKDVNMPLTKVSKGLYINYYPAEFMGFRLAVNQGVLQGADSLIREKGTAEVFRKDRNLHFRSNLLEVYGALEFYPTVFMERYEGLQGKVRPYGLVGLGWIKFRPQAEYYSPNGTKRWVDLQPLRTEGQGMTEYSDRPLYKQTALEVPMGAGLKWYIKENMYMGMEVLHRHTFTDYIDDISTTFINDNLFDKYLTPDQAAVAKQVNNRNAVSTQARTYKEGDLRGKTKNDTFFSTILRFGWRLFDNSDAAGMGCPKW